MLVREAEGSDAPTVADLVVEIVGARGPWGTELFWARDGRVWRGLFDLRLVRVLIAENGEGVPAGMAVYSFAWPDSGDPAWLLLRELFVRESFAGRGVDRLLVEAVQRAATEMPRCGGIRVVVEDGEEMLPLYLEAGFTDARGGLG